MELLSVWMSGRPSEHAISPTNLGIPHVYKYQNLSRQNLSLFPHKSAPMKSGTCAFSFPRLLTASQHVYNRGEAIEASALRAHQAAPAKYCDAEISGNNDASGEQITRVWLCTFYH